MQPESAPPLIRVAVVEDDPFFVQSFTAAIGLAPDVHLMAVAGTCREALALLCLPPADVLLVDLGLPDGSGIEVIRAAQDAWPTCLSVVITVFGDEAHVIQSLEAGAAGYLLKDSAPQRIVEEIRAVVAGGSPISPLIARRLLKRFRGEAVDSGPAPLAPVHTTAPVTLSAATAQAEQSHLSPRETTVLEYITKGFSYEEIGTLMGISRNTVLSFVRRIYAKLKVRSQIEAIHEARALGLLPD